MRNAVIVVALSWLSASAALAQVTMGAMPQTEGFVIVRDVPYTLVDLSHPAPSAATMTTVSVRWSGTCASAFKLKFLRPSAGLTSYTAIAERGPFDAVNGMNLLPLSPSVDVQPGDLLALTQLKPVPITCGAVVYSRGERSAATMTFGSDIAASGAMNGTIDQSDVVGMRASSDADVLEGVVVGAGATAGAFGSFFRTTVQLVNRNANAATGRFVFHPAGSPASASDPSLAYNVAAFSATSYGDIVTAMNASGLGSLDVISTSGAAPLILTRVFTDNGAAGTLGFAEPFVTPDDALVRGDRATIIMPADLTNFRMNVGIRTLSSSVTVDIATTDASGKRYGPTITRTYPANYFEQPSLAQFLNNGTLLPNATVAIFVRDGNGIIFYASTTDNRTNDSSIEFGRRR
jgi:hypothetical protein